MRIRRIRMVLPPRLKATAAHDARLIANSLAERLAEAGTAPKRLTVPGDGAPARALASRAVALVGPRPRSGR